MVFRTSMLGLAHSPLLHLDALLCRARMWGPRSAWPAQVERRMQPHATRPDNGCRVGEQTDVGTMQASVFFPQSCPHSEATGRRRQTGRLRLCKLSLDRTIYQGLPGPCAERGMIPVFFFKTSVCLLHQAVSFLFATADFSTIAQCSVQTQSGHRAMVSKYLIRPKRTMKLS